MRTDFTHMSIQEQTIVDIPEHQVLISFQDDNQAECFLDWFSDNKNNFFKWAEEHRGDYV